MAEKECAVYHPKTGVCRNHHFAVGKGECSPECWRVGGTREVKPDG